MISTINFRRLKSWVGEESFQVRQGPDTIRADWLFDQMVKQLLDNGGVRLFTPSQKCRKPLHVRKLDDLTGSGLVRAIRVNRPPLLILSVSTNGVEMLQGKTEGVNHAVARLAGFWFRLKHHSLSGRQIRMEIGSQRSDGLWRRPQYTAKNAPRNENTPMDW